MIDKCGYLKSYIGNKMFTRFMTNIMVNPVQRDNKYKNVWFFTTSNYFHSKLHSVINDMFGEISKTMSFFQMFLLMKHVRNSSQSCKTSWYEKNSYSFDKIHSFSNVLIRKTLKTTIAIIIQQYIILIDEWGISR